jgi:hypothetical protein
VSLLLTLGRWTLLPLLAGSLCAGEARIAKVLPSLLDRQGRASVAPGLYERDAYQAFLRSTPDQIGGLRIDVRWKAPRPPSGTVRLRLELRGSNTSTNAPLLIEREVTPPRWGGSWTEITLDAAARQQLGDLVAWRASLRRDDEEWTSVQSFLW